MKKCRVLLQKISDANRQPLLSLKTTTLYGYNGKKTYENLDWTIEDGDSWAVLGPGSAGFVEQAFLGRSRAEPPRSRSWPFIRQRNVELDQVVHRVKFRTVRSGDGGFVDWTARWGGIRDEDRLTLLEHLQQNTDCTTENDLLRVAKELEIDHLLSLPFVTLSNGQTRRARIARALLKYSEVLVLEEPFTGLDYKSRGKLSRLLATFHANRSPQILLTLRAQDGVPDWVSHILEIGQNYTIGFVGLKQNWKRPLHPSDSRPTEESIGKITGNISPEIVRLDKVSISGKRPILIEIEWTIREGERWALKGHNGSGKSTLLGLITGDHPQSYSAPVYLFGRLRSSFATSQLQARVGNVSPELANAFPRRLEGPGSLSAREAIATGWEGIYSWRRTTVQQDRKLEELVAKFNYPDLLTKELLDSPFASLSPNAQNLILFLRAFITSAPIILLDEPFSGMDGNTIQKCRDFIDNLPANQTLVIISHYEDEIPLSVNRTLRLGGGKVVERV